MNIVKYILTTGVIIFFYACKSSLPVSEFSSKYPLTELDGTYISGNTRYSGNLSYIMLGGNFHRNNKINKVSFLFNGKDSLNVKLWADKLLVQNIDYKGKLTDNYFEIYFSKKRIIIPPFYYRIEVDRVRLGLAEDKNLLAHFWGNTYGGILIRYGGSTSDISKTYERVNEWESTSEPRLKSFEENGKWGVTDKDQTIILPPEYDDIRIIDSQNILKLRNKDKWAMADIEGKILTPFRYSEIQNYDEEFRSYKVTVLEKGKNLYGYVNVKGEEFIPAIYKYIYNTNIKGIKCLEYNNFHGLISSEGFICPPVLSSINYKFEHKKVKGADHNPDMKYCKVTHNHDSFYLGLDGYLYPYTSGFFKDSLIPEKRFKPKFILPDIYDRKDKFLFF